MPQQSDPSTFSIIIGLLTVLLTVVLGGTLLFERLGAEALLDRVFARMRNLVASLRHPSFRLSLFDSTPRRALNAGGQLLPSGPAQPVTLTWPKPLLPHQTPVAQALTLDEPAAAAPVDELAALYGLPDEPAAAVELIEELGELVGEDKQNEALDDEPEPVLSMTLAPIARRGNALIVGPKGAGKTTVLRYVSALRMLDPERNQLGQLVVALDPHNEQGKWAHPVLGGGAKFGIIMRCLRNVWDIMVERLEAMEEGQARSEEFAGITYATDELGSIVTELPGKNGAGLYVRRTLQQCRKLCGEILAASHDDTADEIGLKGVMGIMQCFDYIIYLGGRAIKEAPKELRSHVRDQAWRAIVFVNEEQRYYLLDLEDRSLVNQKLREFQARTLSPVEAELLERLKAESRAGNSPEISEDFPEMETEPESGFSASESAETEVDQDASFLPLDIDDGERATIISHMKASIAAGKLKTETVQSAPGYSGWRYKSYARCYDQLRSPDRPGARCSVSPSRSG